MTADDSDRRAGDRRRAILDAAARVIARRGVRGLRVEHVAGEAGVAVSLLYYYFRNRSGLIQATLEHANDRAAAAIRDGADGRDTVERTLLAEFDAGARDMSVMWGEVLASAVFEPDLRSQIEAVTHAWTGLVAAAIVAGHADGSIPPTIDAADSAERLTAMVDGLSARWLAGVMTRARARELLSGAVARELAGY